MAHSENRLQREWQGLSKDWYSIYKWERTTTPPYCEWISEWIANEIEQINLNKKGLRQRSFKVEGHEGQAEIQTDEERISVNEKRLVRAMFNLKTTVPLLGEIIDYEVPLKENQGSPHGDIDLLSKTEDKAFCIEAKQPGSTESVLKALLQAFTYTRLVATCRERFYADFGLNTSLKLTPAILTFASVESGKQLRGQDERPHLRNLIATLNNQLSKNGIEPIQFFVIDDETSAFDECLLYESEEKPGDRKPRFENGFRWNIAEE